MTLSAALATASRSLDLFSLGIQVSGNNISNANTPGYVSSHLVIEDGKPYRQGNLLIGTGAFAVGIQQDVDQYLDSRIQKANGEYQLSSALRDSYNQLEGALNSLGEHDLSANLNTFVTSLQAAVNQPENPSIRMVTVDEGQAFADNIRSLRTKLDQLNDSATIGITSLVDKANQLLSTIQSLNPQISQLEANGLAQNDASGLRNQRTAALNQLSELIPIRTTERPDGGVDVFTGSEYLILGNATQKLQLETISVNGVVGPHVQTSSTNSLLDSSGGQLSGLIEGRDRVIHGFQDQLDRYTAAVIFEFNQIHASGEGTKGFTSVAGTYGVDDQNAALNAAGLPFSPRNGSFEIKVKNVGTGITETTNIPIDLDGIGTDTSLASLRTALNGIPQVTATITAEGKLELATAPGFELRFSHDTSGTLAALGINTFFTGSDSIDIQVNEVLQQDAGYLATGQGGGSSDNRNAVLLASAFDQAVSELDNLSIRDFYNHVKGDVAQQSAAQSAVATGLESFRDALSTQRQQQSGVSLDEELIRILQFQHSYQAAARVVSTVEELMNTLLQI